MNSNSQIYINNCGSFYYTELANLINKALPSYKQKKDNGTIIKGLNNIIGCISKIENAEKYTNKSYMKENTKKVKDYFFQEIEMAGHIIGDIYDRLDMDGDFFENQDEIEEIIISQMVDFVYNYYSEYQ